MPHSRIIVQYQNQTISSGLDDIVRYHHTANDLLNYIQNKTRLSQTLVLHIDWMAFQKAFEQNTFLHRITISKLTHSWQHTGSQQAKISQRNNSTCPCCTLPETPDHVFQCTSSRTALDKHETINMFMKEQHQIHTNPSMMWFLSTYLLPWLQAEPIPTQIQIPDDVNHPHLYSAIEDQLNIGINQLPRGRITRFWKIIQFQIHPPTSASSHQQTSDLNWAIKFILSLWKLSLTLWGHPKPSTSQITT